MSRPNHKPSNPDYAARVRAIFEKAPFITDLEIVLSEMKPGACESVLDIKPRHLQQDGFVYAGVLATMADHTAGAVAGTLAGATEAPLTIEFKINLLRPATGPRVRCRSAVLRAGRSISVVESELLVGSGSDAKLVAKATVTLALVPQATLDRPPARSR